MAPKSKSLIFTQKLHNGPKLHHGHQNLTKRHLGPQYLKVLRALLFFMRKNAPGITGHENPKVLFSHENCIMGWKCTTGTKIGARDTSDLKTDKLSQHYGFLCITMHQGSQGTKTQKFYFRTKIAQWAEIAPRAPKFDQGAPRTSIPKSDPSIMVFYAKECTRDYGAPKPKSLIFAWKLHKW